MIGILEGNILELDVSVADKHKLFLFLGLSYYKVEKYSDALKTFVDATPDSPIGRAEEYYELIYYQGLAHYRLNNQELAELLLRKSLESPLHEEIYFSAKIDLALILSQGEGHAPEAISHLTEVKNGIFTIFSVLPPMKYREMVVRAVFNLAQISNSDIEKVQAAAFLDEILPLATPSEKIALLCEKVHLEKLSQKYVLEEIRDAIIIPKLLPTTKQGQTVEFRATMIPRLIAVSFSVDQFIFFQLIEYFRGQLGRLDISRSRFYRDIMDYSEPALVHDIAIALHSLFVTSTVNKIDLLVLYRVGLLKTGPSTNGMFLEFRSLISARAFEFQVMDLFLVVMKIDQLLKQQLFAQVSATLNILRRLFDDYPYLKKYEMLLSYDESRVHFGNGDIESARTVARQAVHEIGTFIQGAVKEDAYFSNELLRSRMDILNRFLESTNARTPAKTAKTYSPNEWINVKYLDGRIERKKYKKVMKELEEGKCSIQSEEAN
ncbi:hypothetical protein D3C87_1218180 [compost metagenome]